MLVAASSGFGSGGHSYISKIFKSQSFSKPICSLDICSSIVSLPTLFCLSILLISHNLFWFTTNTSSLPCPSAPFVFFLLRIKNINKSYFYIYIYKNMNSFYILKNLILKIKNFQYILEVIIFLR